MPRPRKNSVQADGDVSQSPSNQGDGKQTVIYNYGTTETPQWVVSWSGRPRPDETSFFGRDDDLKKLGKQFVSGSGAVISGSAGTGKSRLATEWSEASGTKGIWSQGGATVERTFAATAGLLSIDATGKDDEKLAEDTKNRLAQLPVGTVWVIDDLPSLNQVPLLLAGCGALKVLITTRDGNLNLLPPGVGKLPLTVIDTNSAVEMLRSRGGSGERQVLEELAAAVGFLPLALEMLAARLGQSMARAPDLLIEVQSAPNALEIEEFNKENFGFSVPRTEAVYATVRGSVLAIEEEARNALMCFGYLADAPISEGLAQALSGAQDRAMLENYLKGWQSQSLANWSGDELRVHSLTSAAIRSIDQFSSIDEVAMRAAERSGEIENNDPITARAEIGHMEVILANVREHHGDQMPVELAFFTNNTSAWLTVLGRYEDALKVDEEMLLITERALGPRHPSTLSSRHNLVVSYSDIGRHEDALKLCEETLALRELVLGPQHPDTLTSRNDLGATYSNLGRHEDALKLWEETHSLMEQVLGPEHRHTLGIRNNLAISYADTGRHEEALRFDEETLKLREKILGPEHPDTLSSRHNLAISYSLLGRYTEALRLDDQTLKLREKILGPEHPNTLTSRNDLAVDYTNLGRHDEATRLREINRAIEGDDPEPPDDKPQSPPE